MLILCVYDLRQPLDNLLEYKDRPFQARNDDVVVRIQWVGRSAIYLLRGGHL